MLCSTIITSIGLVSDILGVILIYFWGLPNREHEKVKWECDPIIRKRMKKRSKWGLILLIFGFVLQLLGNCIK